MEWSTQRAQGMQLSDNTLVEMDQAEFAYSDYVADMSKIRDKLVETEHLSKDQADAVIITAALTRDIRKLAPYI